MESIGMTRAELESELRWMMRRVPSDPQKALLYLADVVVTLIEKNNAAVARQLAERDAEDLPEGDG